MTGDERATGFLVALIALAALAALTLVAAALVSASQAPTLDADHPDPDASWTKYQEAEADHASRVGAPWLPLVVGLLLGVSLALPYAMLWWSRKHRREVEAGR